MVSFDPHTILFKHRGLAPANQIQRCAGGTEISRVGTYGILSFGCLADLDRVLVADVNGFGCQSGKRPVGRLPVGFMIARPSGDRIVGITPPSIRTSCPDPMSRNVVQPTASGARGWRPGHAQLLAVSLA